MSDATNAYAAGAAYVDGRYCPIAEASIPLTHWGYRRSDVTYDVVGVRDGAFFRLDDHIRRFRASMQTFRMAPAESDDDIRAILTRLVRLSGLRDAYVAMDCLRGTPPPGAPRHPAHARAYIAAFAVPWVTMSTPEMDKRGIHLVIAENTRRIPPGSVEPRVKNFHWADLTMGLFEAQDRGADMCVLLDYEGNVTEGPGFNVFSVTDGQVATPERGGLDGITRASVIELCDHLGVPCAVRTVPADELRAADEVFICTTAGGVMPVSRIDGRRMNNDAPGPLSVRLKETFWRRRAEGWHATPIDYDAA
ncbi:MAG: aminotransferase class IV [Pararhodobacter sp.]|nr:aminotransferase class IV [Pararhodobacter sp.]